MRLMEYRTRWSTGANQANGHVQSGYGINEYILPNRFRCGQFDWFDYPRGYQVHVSNDGVIGAVQSRPATVLAVTTINFASQIARYIRCDSNGQHRLVVEHSRVHVYGTAGTPPPAPTG